MSTTSDRGTRLRALALSFTTAAVAALELSACGGGASSSTSPSPSPAPAPTYAVTASVSGLATDGLALQSNGATLAVAAGSTSAAFPDRLADGTAYAVTIATQPASRAQTCTVAGGSGTVAGADVAVTVECHATTWALSGVTGGAAMALPHVDGPAAAATFDDPRGMAMDAAGNLYVADSAELVVRKITPDGVVSTYAGSGAADSDGNSAVVDGPAASAKFWFPQGLAIGPDGALYVADGIAVRRIGSDGVVSTVAGSPTEQAYVDGAAADARFNDVTSLRFAADGAIVVTDRRSYAIRRIGTDGVVSTLAGDGTRGALDGTGSAAEFSNPASLVLDADGNILVADDMMLRKLTPAGVVSTILGSESGVCTTNGTGNPLCIATGIAIDAAGNIFVADVAGNGVQMLAPDGTLTLLAVQTPSLDFTPYGVLLAPDGSLLVTDQQDGHARIARISQQ